MAELLAARPASLGDVVDLLRGAADAHLHPLGNRPMPLTHRLPGVAVATTGLLWLGAFASAVAAAEPLTGTLLGLGMMTMFIGLPGDYLAAYRGLVGLGAGAFVVALVAANIVDWPVAGPIGAAALLILLAGTLTLVGIRAGLRPRSRWLAMVGLVGLPAIGALGLVSGGSVLGAALVLPYPVGWALLGLRLIVRGSPTIVDPPVVDPPGDRRPPAAFTEARA
jgi:hypothetical protein